MIIAAVFEIVNIWTQHKCLTVSEWVNKPWHILNIIQYFSKETRASGNEKTF